MDWIQANLVWDWLAPVMRFFSSIGELGAVWVLLGVLLLLRKSTRRLGVYCLLSIALSAIFCNLLLKPLVMRPRPFTVHPQVLLQVAPPDGFSFPSGHTSASFAAATALALGDRRAALPAYLIAVLIGFSRLFFYVHYPSDVLAGLLLGCAIGFAAKWLGGKLLKKWPAFAE